MTRTQPLTMVGIGEILWDMLPGGKQLGGAPANFAYHAHALGQNGVVVSRVGDDELGRELLNKLDDIGLSGQHVIQDRVHRTGTVDIQSGGEGRPTCTMREPMAWDTIETTPNMEDLARTADVVCFGTLAQRGRSRFAINGFLDEMGVNKMRLLDVNLRKPYYSRNLIEDSLKRANILKLSNEELPIIGGMLAISGDERQVVCELARRFGLYGVALTRGDKGSYLYMDGEEDDHPGVAADVVDTLGAGDAFAAALAVGLLRSWTLSFTNNFANVVAAYVCAQPGPTPEIPQYFRQIER